jgi:hypothetical protein
MRVSPLNIGARRVPLSKRGGARRGAGRPTKATALKNKMFSLRSATAVAKATRRRVKDATRIKKETHHPRGKPWTHADHRVAVHAVAVTTEQKPSLSFNKVITEVASLLGYGVSSVGHAYQHYEKHGHFASEDMKSKPRGGGASHFTSYPRTDCNHLRYCCAT